MMLNRRLAALIERLAKKEPPADVTISNINAEIRSVRNRTHFGLHIGNV